MGVGVGALGHPWCLIFTTHGILPIKKGTGSSLLRGVMKEVICVDCTTLGHATYIEDQHADPRTGDASLEPPGGYPRLLRRCSIAPVEPSHSTIGERAMIPLLCPQVPAPKMQSCSMHVIRGEWCNEACAMPGCHSGPLAPGWGCWILEINYSIQDPDRPWRCCILF